MKRLFVSLALVLALAAAAFGAAAGLDVDASDLQAGADEELECDADGVDVEFTTEFTGGDFRVTSVTVSDIAEGCFENSLTVILTGANGAEIASGMTSIDDTSEYVDTNPDVLASDVYDVHVLIS